LPDPLVEPVHDVAFLTTAVVGVVVGGNFDGTSRFSGSRLAMLAPPAERER
jgi:hypothetical protein